MNYQNINHDSPRLDPSLQAYQADFADHVSRGDAGDAFVRGNLEGDVQFPKGPVYAHAVTEWEARSEPRLSPTHDAVGRALASFFTEDGGWVYLTQDMIADEARLRRQSVNRPLQDLVAAGRVERREMTMHQGHRGHAYRLTGEDTGWQPADLGIPGRVTVAGFKKELEKFALEEALQAVVELLPADSVLPDSVLTLLEGINSRREDKSDLLRRLEETSNNGNGGPLSSKMVDSALVGAAPGHRDLVTESQMVAIITEQERTGLSEDDIRASWPDINPGSEVPGALELLSMSRAFRLVAWLRKQPKAPVPKFEPDVPCRCEDVADVAAAMDALPSPEAQAMWEPVLESLANELPRTTFDTWLKDTTGLRFEGNELVVRVPSVFTVAWLEQRMYQSILRALRACSGDQWDVRFEASEAVVCPVHGTSGPMG
ncbi:MAG: hypothetical protein OXE17_01060 [Chloroflexi bacterium]|nr:hypothetical protein [Chloroflexota bacterium]